MSTKIGLVLGLMGCAGGAFDPGPQPDVQSPEPALRRLTVVQYQNTIRDLYGDEIVLPSTLEPDATLEGLASLGASISATSPLGVERYEAAAHSIAEQRLGVEDALPCTPAGASDTACAEAFVEQEGRRVFRRPLTTEETSRFTDLVVGVGAESGDFRVGATVGLAALLQSPHFLYRSEHTASRLDPYEHASRLAYFLWNGPPDEALLASAAAGELETLESREVVVDRLLDDSRYRRGVRDFFSELLELNEIESLTKDPNVFPHANRELWESAREETLHGIEAIVVDKEADYRDLFLTRETWIDSRLAALYGVPAPSLDGFGWVTLPEDGGRRGLLGHASVLGLHAHAISSSATRRGQFIRTKLLCQVIPPPPADVDTSIPEPSADAATLRERLAVHQEVPSCSGCHTLLDNVGLGLENFDGSGRWRTLENNATIDPSGDIDGVEFADAVELGEVIAAHPNTPGCITERTYAYAVGHLPVDGEEALLEWLEEDFAGNGHSVRHLMRRIAISDAFGQGGQP